MVERMSQHRRIVGHASPFLIPRGGTASRPSQLSRLNLKERDILALRCRTNQPPRVASIHQLYCTYMDDYMGSRMIGDFGENNFMWSSDYGHPSMTWPNSRAFIARQLGYLPLAKQERVLSKNVIELYNLDV